MLLQLILEGLIESNWLNDQKKRKENKLQAQRLLVKQTKSEEFGNNKFISVFFLIFFFFF